MVDRLIGRTLLFLLLLPVAWAQETSAQLTGVVRTSGGVALEGVAVEVWTASTRIAADLTDPEGRFFFPESIAFQAVTLAAGALGFLTQEVRVLEGVREYEIELEEDPLVLEGLVVTTEMATCEDGREDPQAQQLWQLARLKYHGVMDTLGVATYLAEADTIVPLSKLGPLDLPVLALSQRSSSSLLRFSWTRRLERDGYAFKVRRVDGTRSYDSWVYAPLDADFAPHFVDDGFGERHRIVVEDEREDGWTLAYCPKEGRQAEHQGHHHRRARHDLQGHRVAVPDSGARRACGRARRVPGAAPGRSADLHAAERGDRLAPDARRPVRAALPALRGLARGTRRLGPRASASAERQVARLTPRGGLHPLHGFRIGLPLSQSASVRSR